MRRLFFILMILFLGGLFSQAAMAVNYEVAGAGTAGANGTYVENGTLNGKPKYEKSPYTLFWKTCPQDWVIVYDNPLDGNLDNNCPIYGVNNTDALPPETGWAARNSGVAPAPTVTRAQSILTYSRSLFTEVTADNGTIDNTTPLIITHSNYGRRVSNPAS